MAPEFEVQDISPQPALTIRATVANAEIPARMGEFFGEIWTYIAAKGAAVAGPPFALYHAWGHETTDMEVGFPVAGAAEGQGRVRASSLPGGRVVTGLHVGPYEKLAETYASMTEWMKARGYVPASRMWECYLTDPETEKDPAKWVTRMYWPIA